MIVRLSAWMVSALLWMPAFARAEEEAGSAMPQLDSTYYASQFFWLVVTGMTLYWLMANIALPRVSRMVDLRDEQVRQDLELAYKLKQQAEDIKVDYTRALREADDKAKALVDGLVKDLKAKQDKAVADAVERVQKQVAQTEIYLRGEKDVLLRDIKIMSDKIANTIHTELKKAHG